MMKKILIMIALLSVSACGVEIIDAGEVGLKKTLGTVEKEKYDSGIQWYNPFLSGIVIMDIKTQKLSGITESFTKDVQNAKIGYTLNFNLDSLKAYEVYTTVGLDYSQKLIPQLLESHIKTVIGKWNAMEVVANRDKAMMDIKKPLAEELIKNGVILTAFAITDISYTPEFQKAVESKVIAAQRAEEAKNKTVQIQEEANQVKIKAIGEAEAMRIKTESLSKSQTLIMYEAVQRWDGALPKIVGSDANLLLNNIPQ